MHPTFRPLATASSAICDNLRKMPKKIQFGGSTVVPTPFKRAC